MAEALLKAVLGHLSPLIGKELGIFLGFDQDLKRLASLLTAVMATLEDAEEKQFSHRAIKDWLQKLRVAAYELDDIMDEYAYEELRLEYEGVKCCLSEMVLSSCLSSLHPMHLVFRYKIAREMKRISERLDQIAKERKELGLNETVTERRSGVIEWRQTTSLITEPQVYGRGKDEDKIVDFLVGDASHSEDISVYPIIGLGGLGKTTLAQLIFNHKKVVKQFEPRIWVCVSEDFSLKTMTKAIIEAESGKACEDLAPELLQKTLRDQLKGKRYLLVLDDVWDEKQGNWQKLKPVLACGAQGASILVTTRLPKVAAIMGTMPPHELLELSNNDCWELFKHQAFGPNEVEQDKLVVIGKEIVKKCGGVPLATKALGGLLRFKREEKEWRYVKESELWSLPHNIMPALRLSYLNLPIELRQCFAYCAIFHKDERIRKQYLIELWMANGFISSNEILDVEDVGDGVWNELYWRSFFQDIETDEFGKVKSFKMHDLVHDLAQFVAEEVCCITRSMRIHHLSYLTREVINPSQLHKVKSLRVLHCIGSELSSSIGDLKHLRYLNLSEGNFKTLPKSLCKLWNLQILRVDHCHSLQKLPNSLICLKALQRLSLDYCTSLSSLPPHIGKLTSLRSLSNYLVGKEKGFLLAELGQLKLKGDLRIEHMEKVESVIDAEEANMSSKQLNGLWLSWDINEEWETQENVEEILEVLQPDSQQLENLGMKGYKGVHLPQWMFSPSLRQLSIEECREVKGLHEALQHMCALQKLTLRDLPKLESLPDCFGNLPLLRELTIWQCSKLRCLPASLCLSSLQSLTIVECPELEKRCEKETGED